MRRLSGHFYWRICHVLAMGRTTKSPRFQHAADVRASGRLRHTRLRKSSPPAAKAAADEAHKRAGRDADASKTRVPRARQSAIYHVDTAATVDAEKMSFRHALRRQLFAYMRHFIPLRRALFTYQKPYAAGAAMLILRTASFSQACARHMLRHAADWSSAVLFLAASA